MPKRSTTAELSKGSLPMHQMQHVGRPFAESNVFRENNLWFTCQKQALAIKQLPSVQSGSELTNINKISVVCIVLCILNCRSKFSATSGLWIIMWPKASCHFYRISRCALGYPASAWPKFTARDHEFWLANSTMKSFQMIWFGHVFWSLCYLLTIYLIMKYS